MAPKTEKNSNPHKVQLSENVKIVVLQRGWIVVGAFEQKPGDPYCTIRNGSVVRVWGTSKGLGELAANGPLSGTILDPAPPMDFHEGVIIMKISCAAKEWDHIINGPK